MGATRVGELNGSAVESPSDIPLAMRSNGIGCSCSSIQDLELPKLVDSIFVDIARVSDGVDFIEINVFVEED